jgi:hypothetical protein
MLCRNPIIEFNDVYMKWIHFVKSVYMNKKLCTPLELFELFESRLRKKTESVPKSTNKREVSESENGLKKGEKTKKGDSKRRL